MKYVGIPLKYNNSDSTILTKLFLQESHRVLSQMHMLPQSIIGAIEIYGKYITRDW